jgi:hypothetical protein
MSLGAEKSDGPTHAGSFRILPIADSLAESMLIVITDLRLFPELARSQQPKASSQSDPES